MLVLHDFCLRESLFDDTADAVLCLAQLLCVIARETKQLRLKEYNTIVASSPVSLTENKREKVSTTVQLDLGE